MRYDIKSGEGSYFASIIIDKPTYYISESEAKSAVNKKVNEAKSSVRSGGYIEGTDWKKVDVRNRTINGKDCVELTFSGGSYVGKLAELKYCYIKDENVVYELKFRADDAIYEDMDENFFEPVLKSFKTSVSLKE
jgi:hypothetical protein